MHEAKAGEKITKFRRCGRKFSRVYNMEAYLIQICGISATNVRQTLHANPSSVDFAQS
jgi:hypothetical protein